MTSRQLADAQRLLADRQAAATSAAAARTGQHIATVASVTPGGGKDGNALVTVTWRGATVTANGYYVTYTPAAGDVVEVGFIDGQLIIRSRIVGIA